MSVFTRSALFSTAITFVACGATRTGPAPAQRSPWPRRASPRPGILRHIRARRRPDARRAARVVCETAPSGGYRRARARPRSGGRTAPSKYISDQFKALGLEPGNPDGTWFQNVELLGFTAQPTAEFHIGRKTIKLDFPTDYVAASRHEQAEVNVDNSDLVFVGYGVVAPEYDWDDYKGVDVAARRS